MFRLIKGALEERALLKGIRTDAGRIFAEQFLVQCGQTGTSPTVEALIINLMGTEPDWDQYEQAVIDFLQAPQWGWAEADKKSLGLLYDQIPYDLNQKLHSSLFDFAAFLRSESSYQFTPPKSAPKSGLALTFELLNQVPQEQLTALAEEIGCEGESPDEICQSIRNSNLSRADIDKINIILREILESNEGNADDE